MKRLASEYDSRKHRTHTYALRKTLARMHTQHFNKRVIQETLKEMTIFKIGRLTVLRFGISFILCKWFWKH